jgi:hypothetical protein
MIIKRLSNNEIPGATWANRVAEAIEWLSKIRGGPGVRVDKGADGPAIFVKQLTASTSIKFLDHPWKLFQAEDDDPGLVVSMLPGIVQGVSSSTLNPLNSVIPFTPAAFTDDAETKVWAAVSIEKVAYTTYFSVWAISSIVIATGETVPTDTLDVGAGTDGDVYVLIGTVTTESGAVTSIVQALFSPLTYNLPTELAGPATGIHVLVSDEGVIDWVEADPDPECPTPPE